MKKIIISSSIVISIGLIVFGIVSFFQAYNRVVVKPNIVKTEIKPTATPTPDPLAPYSIALLGYGGGNHDGGLLTDTIMIAKIDPRKEIVSLISIPRDLWVPIPIKENETKNFKINEAYSIGRNDKQYPNKKVEFTGKAGGGEMAKYVIGQILGFKIDNFVAIDFDGFVKLIDVLGGVDINVKKTFDDPHYPLELNVNDTCGKSEEEIKALEATMSGDKLDNMFTCRYENLHFEKGIQHMDGITALKFARSRHSPTDGGDFNRAARQRLVVTAVRDKIMSIGFLPKIIPTIKTLSYNITTDIDVEKMNKLIESAESVSKYKVVPIALTDENVLVDARASTGQMILSPLLGENNWDGIRTYIASMSAKSSN